MSEERQEVIDGLFSLNTTNIDEWRRAGEYAVENNIEASDLHEYISTITDVSEDDHVEWTTRAELFEQALWLAQAKYQVERGEL